MSEPATSGSTFSMSSPELDRFLTDRPGDLLCGLAGGGGINSIAGSQSLLSSLGVNLSTTQIQTLLLSSVSRTSPVG
jgi:hypothetical protein